MLSEFLSFLRRATDKDARLSDITILGLLVLVGAFFRALSLEIFLEHNNVDINAERIHLATDLHHSPSTQHNRMKAIRCESHHLVSTHDRLL